MSKAGPALHQITSERHLYRLLKGGYKKVERDEWDNRMQLVLVVCKKEMQCCSAEEGTSSASAWHSTCCYSWRLLTGAYED